jgi:hypothetical protein
MLVRENVRHKLQKSLSRENKVMFYFLFCNLDWFAIYFSMYICRGVQLTVLFIFNFSTKPDAKLYTCSEYLLSVSYSSLLRQLSFLSYAHVMISQLQLSCRLKGAARKAEMCV